MMVPDAVSSEPLFGQIFPACRELCRQFLPQGFFAEGESQGLALFSVEIPEQEQGIFLPGAG